MTRLSTFADPEAVAARAAAEIVQHVRRAREQRGMAHVALSGGSTPARTYELLAEELGEWKGVEVWFADERCVEPEEEQSNYRMVRETLLGRIPIPPEQVHRMKGELGPEQGAELYAQALRARVAGGEEGLPVSVPALVPTPVPVPVPAPVPALVPVLDLVVLGIGPDGHVASLFPGAATLEAGEEAVCLGVHDSPKPPPERITLSLAMLRAARRCMLLATGAGKKDAVSAALAKPTAQVPASLLRRERLTVIVDDAASPPPPVAHEDADSPNLQ